MNNEETVTLCIHLRQVVPAQKFDEMTPLEWQPILAKVRAADAIAACKLLAGEREFIGPSHIIAKVKEIRQERVKAGPRFDPDAYRGWVPDDDNPGSGPIDPDNGLGYILAMRDHTRRLADGEPPLPVPDRTETTRDVAALLAPLVQRSRPAGDE